MNQLAHNPKIRKIALNIAGGIRFGEDLYQHLFLTLCEKEDQKIIEAYDKKYLEFLCISIMQNNYHSVTSPFYKINRHNISYDELHEQHAASIPDNESEIFEHLENYELKIKPIEDYINQQVTQDNFYKITLVRQWANGDSYRTIAKKTKIPMKSIAVAIQTALKEIKEKC